MNIHTRTCMYILMKLYPNEEASATGERENNDIENKLKLLFFYTKFAN